MINKRILVIIFLIMTIAIGNALSEDRGITNTTSSSFVKLKSIDIGDVKWTNGFWADKFEQASTVMVPHMWELLNDPEIGHAFTNFEIAAGLKKGEFKGTWWHDGDFYKWLEAAAYVYAITEDKKIDQHMDRVIQVIAKAQQPDGYLSTPVILNGVERFSLKRHHELYNMGHLMTTACIHHRITGKKSLLNVAIKTADYLYNVFAPRPQQLGHLGWNPSNIMGLVELYRTTGNQKYLELAGVFIDMRGSLPVEPHPLLNDRDMGDHNQDRTPLRDETEAVGHAVTAMYLYAGAADVFAETGEKALINALDKIRNDVVSQKMYITGAVGLYHNGLSSHNDKIHEAFGSDYQLHNETAYNETCANIGNAMFNWRMLGIKGEAKYADIMERVLYNSALSGISIDGKHYFYTNPLRRLNGYNSLMHDFSERQSYLDCFCCPPNIVRTIVKCNGWAYSISNQGIWINLYGGNELDSQLLDGSKIKILQETDYPWDGKVKVTIQQCKKEAFPIMLRIPEWTQGATLTINGALEKKRIQSGQYFELNSKWKKGDVIELNLPMTTQLINANPKVEEVRGQVAVKRGPVVYALETADLPENTLMSQIVLPADIQLVPEYRKEFLGGVTILKGEVLFSPKNNWENSLYKPLAVNSLKKFPVQFVPYFAWNNRGVGEMTVWLPVSYRY